MPSPVTKRPRRVGAVPPESQSRGKPARATQRVAARSVAGGRARARRLPRRRPASMATKKRVRAAADPERVRPPPARKSAPQYQTHHSDPTPKVTSAQNAQYRGGNARGPVGAPPSPATSRSGGPADRKKERAARRASAATGATSAGRQPRPDAAKAPTSSGAEMAQALAATLDSDRATAAHSPCLSESSASEATSSRAPQTPIASAAGSGAPAPGRRARRAAPRDMPAAPP